MACYCIVWCVAWDMAWYGIVYCGDMVSYGSVWCDMVLCSVIGGVADIA